MAQARTYLVASTIGPEVQTSKAGVRPYGRWERFKVGLAAVNHFRGPGPAIALEGLRRGDTVPAEQRAKYVATMEKWDLRDLEARIRDLQLQTMLDQDQVAIVSIDEPPYRPKVSPTSATRSVTIPDSEELAAIKARIAAKQLSVERLDDLLCSARDPDRKVVASIVISGVLVPVFVAAAGVTVFLCAALASPFIVLHNGSEYGSFWSDLIHNNPLSNVIKWSAIASIGGGLLSIPIGEEKIPLSALLSILLTIPVSAVGGAFDFLVRLAKRKMKKDVDMVEKQLQEGLGRQGLLDDGSPAVPRLASHSSPV